jgi:hypothetical protein
MKSGIYKLYWTTEIYIGQSVDIFTRYKEHCRSLKSNKHSNYKLQRLYNDLLELPKLEVLEFCKVSILNDKEIYYTVLFDSITNGLNLIEAGKVGWGPNSNSSKYSKLTILKVWCLLAKRHDLSLASIAERLKIPKHVVSDISTGKSHAWLHAISDDYTQLATSRNNRRCSRQKITGFIKDPLGTLTCVNDLNLFVIENYNDNYRSAYENFRRLLKGERKSYLGFTLHQPCSSHHK